MSIAKSIILAWGALAAHFVPKPTHCLPRGDAAVNSPAVMIEIQRPLKYTPTIVQLITLNGD